MTWIAILPPPDLSFWWNEIELKDGFSVAARMTNSFLLLTLLRAEIDRLEKLRRLEKRLGTVDPIERPGVQLKIDSLMDEIAKLNRDIQEYKANYLAIR